MVLYQWHHCSSLINFESWHGVSPSYYYGHTATVGKLHFCHKHFPPKTFLKHRWVCQNPTNIKNVFFNVFYILMHLIYIILMSNILLSIGWIEKQEQIHLWRDVSNYLHSYTNTAWLNVHPVMILFLDFYMNFSLRSSTKVQIVKIFTLLIFSAWWKKCSLKRNYNLYLLMIILIVKYCFFALRPTVIWLQPNNPNISSQLVKRARGK